MIWAVAGQWEIITLIGRDNIKYVSEEQIVMMVGWVKTVLVMGWHFWPNNLTTAGKLCKLVPPSPIECILINIQFAL